MSDKVNDICATAADEIRSAFEDLRAELRACFVQMLGRLDEISRRLEAGRNE